MTPPRLIGISGYARSGKSTTAQAVHEIGDYDLREFKEALQKVLLAQDPLIPAKSTPELSFPLSQIVSALGWDGAKDHYPEVRRLMIDLGTKGCREYLGENVWVDAAFRTIGDDDAVVFTDCRFPNEAQRIKDNGGIVVRVDRPGVGPIDLDVDTAMDGWTFDWTITNDGSVADLRRQVQYMLDVFDPETGAEPVEETVDPLPPIVKTATDVVIVPHGTKVVSSPRVKRVEVTSEENLSGRFEEWLVAQPMKTWLDWQRERSASVAASFSDRDLRRVDL